MLKREEWANLGRNLEWDFSYVSERTAFPEVQSGRPWLPNSQWAGWDEPYKTTYAEYVAQQSAKDASVDGARDSVGKVEDYDNLPMPWLNAVGIHAATLTLAEFAAVVGSLRAARFGRTSAWRTAATLGALDEIRHTQIPLQVMRELVTSKPQFDWTHKFYHSNNWVAIAARRLMDELLLGANAIEFAIGANFVFETGFTNLQFIALSSLAHGVGDRMFERMLGSIQSDEARHAQIGLPVLATVVKHDPEYAQYLVDKWFWRSWMILGIVTGISMDYLSPLEARSQSFKEFMQEWVLDQYLSSLRELGLSRPWYWDIFVEALDYYHHMVYASAYTYRASVWFDLVVPGPRERAWLHQKYPKSWEGFAPIWTRITDRWRETDPGNDFAVHSTALIGFCNLCQVVLCGGTPGLNSANTLEHEGSRYIFCSQPCRWIFEREPERYAKHKDVVKRVLDGEAPANLVALIQQYFGLSYATWGKDAFGGVYPWLKRDAP